MRGLDDLKIKGNEKGKIVIFGINDAILRAIRNEIDPRKAEIVCFVDNDQSKTGTYFMDIPVVELEKVDKDSIDYFLVAALSAYEEVKKQLIEFGVSRERIQMFVTEQLCEFCIGELEDIDVDLIHYIYFEPERIMKYVTQYQELYREYKLVPKCEEVAEAWYNRSTLISHACGGVVNGKRLMYSNSKEAFQYSMDEKFHLIECDMLFAGNKELVLAHDYERFYEAQEENYSMMTAKELFESLRKYPYVKCLIDVKWDAEEEYAEYIGEIKRILNDICEAVEEYEALKKQIVMEVYNETTIKIAMDEGFEVIFTQYRNPERKSGMSIVNLCSKYGVKVVAMALSVRTFQRKFMKIVTDKNIKIFVFSTNSVMDYIKLREAGVTGVMTDYLVPREIEGKEMR